MKAHLGEVEAHADSVGSSLSLEQLEVEAHLEAVKAYLGTIETTSTVHIVADVGSPGMSVCSPWSKGAMSWSFRGLLYCRTIEAHPRSVKTYTGASLVREQ